MHGRTLLCALQDRFPVYFYSYCLTVGQVPSLFSIQRRDHFIINFHGLPSNITLNCRPQQVWTFQNIIMYKFLNQHRTSDFSLLLVERKFISESLCTFAVRPTCGHSLLVRRLHYQPLCSADARLAQVLTHIRLAQFLTHIRLAQNLIHIRLA